MPYKREHPNIKPNDPPWYDELNKHTSPFPLGVVIVRESDDIYLDLAAELHVGYMDVPERLYIKRLRHELDIELPGMWERADFTGGETDT